MTRQLKPCGTAGGYGRHRLHGEPVCEPCQIAWRDYHRARRATGRTLPEGKRELAPCGTFAAAQRHRKHGEPVCDACAQADRVYKAQKAREYRAAKKARRAELDQLLAETWAEVSAS